jgi:recombination protein RecR
MEDLVSLLKKLPGIGRRSAERLAFHILTAPSDEALALADAIRHLKTTARYCSRCFNFAEDDLCYICTDAKRDSSKICVVEQPKDVILLESSGLYNGLYHVLMGCIDPLSGVGPDAIKMDNLLERAADDGVKEIILATNPTAAGDGTALYIAEQLAKVSIKITRLARGLASGGSLEYASRNTLADAFGGRRDMR